MGPLKTAFWNYDRTLPLVDGRVRADGVELAIELLNPDEIFARAFGTAEFDICELSFSKSVTAVSVGDFPYVLIPVFLSRAFRHSAIFVRADAPMNRGEDLKGCSVGVYDYGMTGAVVVRGFLRDYDVQPQDISWKVGEGNDPTPTKFASGRAPEGVSIELLPPGRRLEHRLLEGEIGAMISLQVPVSASGPSPAVRSLYADPTAAERAWYEKRRIFPIMHAVAIRRSLTTKYPGLAMNVYRAFIEAKDLAIAELENLQAPKVTLPWPHAVLLEARNLMGPDLWPYGLAANHHVLQAQLQWSFSDGLQARRVTVDELFAPECYET